MVEAYVLIRVEAGMEKAIMNKLQELANVEEVHIIYGEWDLIAKVKGKTIEEVSEFVMERIRGLEGVRLTSTMLIAK